MFQYPDAVKERKNSWTIRQVKSLEDRLKKINFPD
jgi:hypothetical protein